MRAKKIERDTVHKSPIDIFDKTSEWGSISLGIENVKKVLIKLGNPHKSYKHVLIGGTNGKGTVAYNVARNVDCQVGLFLSPHVWDIRERITINGQYVPDEEWKKAYDWINAKVNHLTLSYFEWLLVIAVVVFANNGVELGIFEVGLGGRLDATNALSPTLSVLTNVSLDHQKFLGNTIEEIALEKIEIARKGKIFLLPKNIFNIPKVKERLKKCEIICQIFEIQENFNNNLCIANKILELLNYNNYISDFISPLGRRIFINYNKGIYIDGCHNKAGWLDCVTWLKSKTKEKLIIATSLSKERNPELFIECLKPISEKIYIWECGYERELSHQYWPHLIKTINAQTLIDLTQENPVAFLGSLYSIKHTLKVLKENEILKNLPKT